MRSGRRQRHRSTAKTMARMSGISGRARKTGGKKDESGMYLTILQGFLCMILAGAALFIRNSDGAFYQQSKAVFHDMISQQTQGFDFSQAVSAIGKSFDEIAAAISFSISGEPSGEGGAGGGKSAPANATFEVPKVSVSLAVPVSGTVTSSFGYREHPVTGEEDFHDGVDIAAPTGTDVAASYAGTVAETGSSEIFGNYVLLEHAEGFETFYGHLSSIAVSQGQFVSQGRTIGKVGSTGLSTGPHLHFRVKIGGLWVDPQKIVAIGESEV